MRAAAAVALAAAAPAPARAAAAGGAIGVNGSAAADGRRHDGIGGLSNSCAPWLRSYPEPQRSHILDYLFLPNFGAAVQILKLEIGGDGHSTINTESSHRHSAGATDMRAGWEWWIATEAKKRNPDIVISALPWTYPYWVKGNESVVYEYIISWVKGMRSEYGIGVDYVGLHNEGTPSGSPSTSVEGFRAALDAAGLPGVLVVSGDGHDFGACSGSDAYLKAVGVIGVHEPLRSREAVPADCLATGKPLWSSESYTTYSDSNGGGCWARALNWGWVKGSVTAHMAWNLIQSYPTSGSGMNYNGHGLMWADSPWSGHYTVNSPIWVTAHYTQATEVGWRYLPVGSGSGDLPGGGTFLTLASAAGAAGRREFALVAQTMEYDNSKCFKDSHPSFTVRNQTVSFALSADLVPASGTLYVRRTVLFPGDPIDPYVDEPGQCNVYYEELPAVSVGHDGAFSIELPINALVTVSTRQGAKGVHPVPPHAAFPYPLHDDLSGYTAGEGGRYFIDQQGVWNAVGGGAATVMTQVVPAEPEEWHGWGKIRHPQTFIGPPVPGAAAVACAVRPAGTGFAGVGVGAQATGVGALGSAESMLAVWANGTWAVAGHSGSAAPPAGGWFDVELRVGGDGTFAASVGGAAVASGAGFPKTAGGFPFLASSYGPAAFRALSVNATEAPPPTPAPPAPPPAPPPPAGAGLQMAACAAGDARQAWTFTGEDGGEPGRLIPSSNTSGCLDALSAASAAAIVPAELTPCAAGSAGLLWNFSSASGSFASVATTACLVAKHGSVCHRCLDVASPNDVVNVFDCKPGDGNQVWSYDPATGASPLQHGGRCLGAY